ncbi:hypothetical protein HanIR_Chr09g0435891 [Helianthus annuus]|nr:hypothetical protein HanIR_Chr09g0435891 [Helianthus annuus]
MSLILKSTHLSHTNSLSFDLLFNHKNVSSLMSSITLLPTFVPPLNSFSFRVFQRFHTVV